MDAADILKSARRDAGLTLKLLAESTGVPESRLSDYEHGRHQPSVAMLQRVLKGTGHVLVALPERSLDQQRNARVFEDLLSLVDAVPFGTMHEQSGRSRDLPPTWSDNIRAAKSAS